MEKYTVYLKSKYSPSNQDWIKGEDVKHTSTGVWVYPSFYNSDPIFFPWSSVERVEQCSHF